MHIPSRFLIAATCAAASLFALSAQAQGSVRGAINVVPSASARAALAAPNPAGLRSPFPAGVSSGSGAAVSGDNVAASTATTQPGAVEAATLNPGLTDSENMLFQPNAAVDTTVMGAPGYGVARGPGRGPTSGGSGGYSAVDVARSFINADGNRDNELTRSEALRLSLALMSFEEMDRNYDGVISRSEYEDSLR
jgi:hypothetical protein